MDDEFSTQKFINYLCDLNRLEYRRKEIMSIIGRAYMKIARDEYQKIIHQESLDLLDEALKLLDNKE